ncbi:sugar transferase [Martelella alba]|uniref:Sugar transferase n=2 Tax=Martelella alba TaxID=2590451 RepID=A0A506U949_9HYPH|nr:sugar transferase [Martelella alba]TPW30893.1 sugar transferase [Martelella alba]
MVKRVFDLAVSLSALIALFPLFLIVATLIKLDNPGPVFFTQTRWGQGGKKINIFKFRSMRTDLGDKSGVQQTIANDPRITKIGAFMRRTNIDELPQLINVVKGDMSLIGPRCHAVGMLAGGMLYEELVPEYHMRHLMKPGLSGLAQIRGWRGPTTRRGEARARVMCDLYYVSNFNLLLDAKIFFATIRSEVGRGTGF